MVASAKPPTAPTPPPVPKLKSSVHIPLTVKLKARSLYLIHGLPYAEIGKQTGMKPQAVRNLAFYEGWTKTKAQTKAALIKRADARDQVTIDEVSEAIAIESEEIAMSGLNRSRQAAESDGKDAAKDFQAWTGGARNLVNIARACRGLDGRGGASEAGCGVTNIFAVGSLTFNAGCNNSARGGETNTAQQAAEREPVNVTPVQVVPMPNSATQAQAASAPMLLPPSA